MIADILVNGLVRSGVYAMLALGFGLVFGVGRVLNLAHTAFYMVASYGILHFVTTGLGTPLAVTLTALGVIAVGLALYKFFIEPVREMESTVLIATLAVAILLQELILVLFGSEVRHVPAAFPGYTRIAGVRLGNQEMATLVLATISLIGTWLLLSRTRLGLAIRAAAQDREVANLMGINVNRVTAIVMALGFLLASLAGAAVAPLLPVEPRMWMHPLVIVLAAVVLGGLGSLKGSVIGAVILAFAEVLVVFLIPGGSYLRTAVALLIMVCVFLIRPEGLFGASATEER
ncbi:MAG TPA: branched-chain amino acid ABC transporter permease [Candidatus Acetothermia bacterium]|nr:branched-chain amino acid ABC transporter permease [Candidatus Acetothermia bacterium]